MALNYDCRLPPEKRVRKRVNTAPWPWHNKTSLTTQQRIDEVDALISGITARRRPGWESLVAHLRERREVLERQVKPRARERKPDGLDADFSKLFAKLRG